MVYGSVAAMGYRTRSPEGEARRLAAVRSPEARAKMSASKKGKTPKNHSMALQKAWEITRAKGLNSYTGYHNFVRRTWGTPDTCELCGTSGLSGRRIHWALRDHGIWTEKREGWLRLCRPCHARYDMAHNGTSFRNGRAKPIES